jgi:hypothetical protein
MALRDRLRIVLDAARRAARELERAGPGGEAAPPAPGPGTGPGGPAPSGPVAPAGSAGEATGIASPDPLRWVDGATVAGLLGRPVGEPELLRDAETDGVRFRAPDGATLEIRSLREDALGRYDRGPAQWIDEQAAAASSRFPVANLGDYAVGTTGDDGAACYCWCADACFMVRVSGAEGLEEVPEALLRILYDWPA